MAIKQLTLLGSTIKGIIEYGSLLFHFSQAGVDVHNLLGERLAYAELSTVTCGAVNSNGVYLGTGTGGIYKLTHAAVAAGGDQTAELTQAITTATTPAISSNAVAGIAGNGTAILVTTDLGANYLPNESTVYSYADAGGCGACAINGTEIAYILADQTVHRLNHPTADWTSGDATVISGAAGDVELTYESDLAGPAYPYSLIMVPGTSQILYGCNDASHSLWLYTLLNGALNKVSEGETYGFATIGGDITPDGAVVAIGNQNSPYLTWYTLSGTTLTKLTDPTGMPAYARTPQWCKGDTQYLAAPHALGAGSEGLSLYKRNGTAALTKLPAPPQPPGYGINCRWNGNYLVVASTEAPYLTLYRRDGDTLTKLSSAIDISPGSTSYRMSWLGNYLALSLSVSPYLLLYEFDEETETLTRQTGAVALPAMCSEVAWHPDGEILAVSWQASPYLGLYKRTGGTLTKVSEISGGILEKQPSPLTWSNDGAYLIGALFNPTANELWVFSLGESGGGELLAPANCVAFGADLFIGSDGGIDIIGSSSRAIASPDANPIAALCPTPSATTSTGRLAYGTGDGGNGGQFGVIDLSA